MLLISEISINFLLFILAIEQLCKYLSLACQTIDVVFIPAPTWFTSMF